MKDLLLYYLIALTPKKIRDFFTPIIKLAKSLKKTETLKQLHGHEPIITVSCFATVGFLFVLTVQATYL